MGNVQVVLAEAVVILVVYFPILPAEPDFQKIFRGIAVFEIRWSVNTPGPRQDAADDLVKLGPEAPALLHTVDFPTAFPEAFVQKFIGNEISHLFSHTAKRASFYRMYAVIRIARTDNHVRIVAIGISYGVVKSDPVVIGRGISGAIDDRIVVISLDVDLLDLRIGDTGISRPLKGNLIIRNEGD